MDAVMEVKEGSEIPGGWERVEIACIACMQMTWVCVGGQRKT